MVFDFGYLCFEVHARRIAALKALTFAPASNSQILAKLYEIVFGILDKVCSCYWYCALLAKKIHKASLLMF